MRANQKAIDKMDLEKSGVSRTSKQIEGRKAIYFFRDIKQELKKVEWTNKEELKGYVKIVLISVLSLAVVVYGIDLIIQGALGLINRMFS
jgi:preprotein translocase subunit SecE